MVRENLVQSQVESYQRSKKMVIDPSLLTTQHYKEKIKGKVDQSRERSSSFPYTLALWLLKRETSGHPQLRSPTLRNFMYITLLNEPERFSHTVKRFSYISIQQSQFNIFHIFAHIVCSIWPIDRTNQFLPLQLSFFLSFFNDISCRLFNAQALPLAEQ